MARGVSCALHVRQAAQIWKRASGLSCRHEAACFLGSPSSELELRDGRFQVTEPYRLPCANRWPYYFDSSDNHVVTEALNGQRVQARPSRMASIMAVHALAT